MIFGRTILPTHCPFVRMSTMTSLFRPLLTSILCCVLAFGHAPAWLHVVTCDDHCGHATTAGHAADSDKHTHVCPLQGHQSHPAVTPSTEKPSTEKPSTEKPSTEKIEQFGQSLNASSGTHTPHNSEGCGICQSLAAPCGFADATFASPASGVSCKTVVLWKQFAEISSQLSLPPLRGPPRSNVVAI
jgi:hypothetical protein